MTPSFHHRQAQQRFLPGQRVRVKLPGASPSWADAIVADPWWHSTDEIADPEQDVGLLGTGGEILLEDGNGEQFTAPLENVHALISTREDWPEAVPSHRSALYHGALEEDEFQWWLEQLAR
jgi:hypothetical protein